MTDKQTDCGIADLALSRRHFGGMVLASVAASSAIAVACPAVAERHRVLVSTDIGGTDPDDFQSLVHLLVSADAIDLEGLVSSPFGPGRLEHILEVIDVYERDYPNLATWSALYPTPGALRAISKQGATDVAGHAGVDAPTEGSDWIVACARRDDPRPLHVLVWGGIEDLAQALHDAPDILPKLRVYFIGGPNKKWSVDAYQYVATNHPELAIIEANSTYRGWFVGGNQAGRWGNREFVERHVAPQGALGAYFATQLEGVIKMGDTPSVGWVMQGNPADPAQSGWGGAFVRAWDRPLASFRRLTSAEDRIEQFGVLELALPFTSGGTPEAVMVIENQRLVGAADADGHLHFRFSPKDAKTYSYAIESETPELSGLRGALTSVAPAADAARRPSARWPNWWTDNPDPALAEGPHQGAKTVSRWREQFLADFATRMARAAAPTLSPATGATVHPRS